MQTFLPYPNFAESARALDNRRLANQRNEALVILKQLLGLYERGWPDHPAVRMWRGYEVALLRYTLTVCTECARRGIKDSVFAQAIDLIDRVGIAPGGFGNPPWVGDEAFHRSHRSNLLRKDPDHYGGLPGFDVPSHLPYVWPETEGA